MMWRSGRALYTHRLSMVKSTGVKMLTTARTVMSPARTRPARIRPFPKLLSSSRYTTDGYASVAFCRF